ncbi:lasso peptide biosynthesis PqqD family chaperone [Neobacillus drentensis]|uniref:lasso peptide biosynthesis PqqD family chaperone n=1 Tax=Neobacillus drentensis TaxID=220684 RepID=UPI002FFEFB52
MLKDKRISVDCLIVQKEGNIVSDMDGEKVMLSISNGKYYNLGEMGGVIWDIIKNPISLNQLIVILMSEYEVEKRECEQQVFTFVDLLYSEDLIKIID